MTLYRKNGGEPQNLPFRDRDGSGNSWTDLANNPDARTACGWEAAPDEPEYDPQTQKLVWGESDWEIEDADRPTAAEIDRERDARIMSGCTVAVTAIGDIPVVGRQQDKDNMQGLVQAATIRISAGDTATLTPFRDNDDVIHQLTPPQVVELWQGAASYLSAVYQYSWALKDNPPVPYDFKSDAYWPAPQWPQPE